MYCWYLRNTYLENKLIRPGGTVQCGLPCRWIWGRSTVPAFVRLARGHIVPMADRLRQRTQLLGGDVRFVLGASSHIAGVINPPGQGQAQPLGRQAAADADRWLNAPRTCRAAGGPPGWTGWANTPAARSPHPSPRVPRRHKADRSRPAATSRPRP